VGTLTLPETFAGETSLGVHALSSIAAEPIPASLKKSLRDNIEFLLFCILYQTEAVL
jgi:hypothetical protein